MARESVTINFAGTPAELDLSGAVYWPEWRFLTVADLHFEKGSSFAERRYLLVPPHDTAETLSRLDVVIRKYEPRQVICLGDSFHDKAAATRLNLADLDALQRLSERCAWTWLSGNHDPAPPESIGGRAGNQVVVGDIVFQHDPDQGEMSSDSPRAKVFGHYHPVAVLSAGGRLLRRKSFVQSPDSLLLPAFGAYAGGLNVLDAAIQKHFSSGFKVIALGRTRHHVIDRRSLHLDAPSGR